MGRSLAERRRKKSFLAYRGGTKAAMLHEADRVVRQKTWRES